MTEKQPRPLVGFDKLQKYPLPSLCSQISMLGRNNHSELSPMLIPRINPDPSQTLFLA